MVIMYTATCSWHYSRVFMPLIVCDATVLQLSNITVCYMTKSLFSLVIVTLLWDYMEYSKFDIELNWTIRCIVNSFGMSIYAIVIWLILGHILFGQIDMNYKNTGSIWLNWSWFIFFCINSVWYKFWQLITLMSRRMCVFIKVMVCLRF